MLNHVLELNKYDLKSSTAALSELHKQIFQIVQEKENALKALAEEDRYSVVFTVFQATGFNVQSNVDLINAVRPI